MRVLAIGLLLTPPWLVAAAVLLLGGRGPDGSVGLRALVAAALVFGAVAIGRRRGARSGLLVATAAALGVVAVYAIAVRPSHDRAWTEDQRRLPRVQIDGDRLIVLDQRAFRYRDPSDWDARWEDRTWDLRELEGVDFVVEPFGAHEAVAHTFVSFRFRDDVLAVSIEIRKEIGETYSPWRGLFRNYELMFVFADERDVVELRAVHRGHPVVLHPLTADPAFARAFLERLVAHAQAIERRPQFYNTLTASCTSVLAAHLRALIDVPLDHRLVVPGHADALAHELGMLDTPLDLASTRAANRIDARARAAAGQPDFSARIREGWTGPRWPRDH